MQTTVEFVVQVYYKADTPFCTLGETVKVTFLQAEDPALELPMVDGIIKAAIEAEGYKGYRCYRADSVTGSDLTLNLRGKPGNMCVVMQYVPMPHTLPGGGKSDVIITDGDLDQRPAEEIVNLDDHTVQVLDFSLVDSEDDPVTDWDALEEWLDGRLIPDLSPEELNEMGMLFFGDPGPDYDWKTHDEVFSVAYDAALDAIDRDVLRAAALKAVEDAGYDVHEPAVQNGMDRAIDTLVSEEEDENA
jgi:hypothetical protein